MCQVQLGRSLIARAYVSLTPPGSGSEVAARKIQARAGDIGGYEWRKKNSASMRTFSLSHGAFISSPQQTRTRRIRALLKKHTAILLLCVVNPVGMEIEHKTERAQERGWVRGAIIGAGASGTVSLAMNSSNGQLFAVKSAAGFSAALHNEYQILQPLDSPYIVRCLGRDYSVENGAEVHNLFMEYMPGGSVADLLAKFGGQLEESVIRAYTRGILRGIHYLHRQGIVHCDIKGKNVLVGANGVKLADFGSARRIGDEEKGHEALQLRGTPQWMAPEVVNQVEQGPASDIRSFACTVLEMTTGRPPWSSVSSALAAMYVTNECRMLIRRSRAKAVWSKYQILCLDSVGEEFR